MVTSTGEPESYQVSELAKLAGVSVRTLHHYDQIGLLVPSGRTAGGYRSYGSAELDRLQEILVYRRLGLPLAQIRDLLTEPGHDRRATLRRQRELLAARLVELREAVALVDTTIRSLEEGTVMTGPEKFEGLGTFERNEAEHGAEVRQRWGDTQAYEESQRRTRRYTEQDWAQISDERDTIEAGLAELLTAGVPAEDQRAVDLAEQHRLHIDRWFYPCPARMHVGLGDMYAADPRFTKHYEDRAPGLAAYVRDAIRANAQRE